MNSENSYDDLRQEFDDTETEIQNLELEIAVCHSPTNEAVTSLQSLRAYKEFVKSKMDSIVSRNSEEDKNKKSAFDFCLSKYSAFRRKKPDQVKPDFMKYFFIFETLWEENAIRDHDSLWLMMRKEIR